MAKTSIKSKKSFVTAFGATALLISVVALHSHAFAHEGHDHGDHGNHGGGTPAAAPETPASAETPTPPATGETPSAAPEVSGEGGAGGTSADSSVEAVAAEVVAEPEDEEEEEIVMMEGIGGEAAAETVEEVKGVATAAPEKATDLETPDVVITGTQLERSIKEAPVRTQVVKKEQLEQRKARNVAESLSYTTGVRVETNCQNCGFTSLRLNGLEGAYTQVLIDGLPSFSGLAGVYGLEQLPAELIGRIEVVKGGGSSLYGPSAVAGVVNILTRKPKENFVSAISSLDIIEGNSVTVEYDEKGNQKPARNFVPDLRLTADAGIVSDDGRLGAHLFVASRQRGAVDLNGDQFSEMTKLQQLSGGANFMFTPLKNMDLQIAFHAAREYRRGGDNLELPPHDVGVAEALRTDRLQGEIRFKHKVNALIDYSLGYVFSYTDRNSYYGGEGDVPPIDVDHATQAQLQDHIKAKQKALKSYGKTTNPLQIADAKVNLSYDAWGPQVVTAGLQFSADNVDDRYLGQKRFNNETFTDIGFYLQHDWIFADWGESVVGARIDKANTVDTPIVSPRAALSLKFFDWLRLRSAFSMGFRAPQAFDEDLHVDFAAGKAVLVSNVPDLKPERSLSLSQQVTTDFHLSNGDELDASINGYFTRLTDAFHVDKDNDTNPATKDVIETMRENTGTRHVYGVEMALGYKSKYYAMRAGWTFENAINSEPDDFAGQETYRVFRAPNNYGYLDFLGKYGGFQGQTGLSITGPMLVPHEKVDAQGNETQVITESGWFFEWNINAGYAFQTMGSFVLEPFIGIRNILNDIQKDYDANGSDRDSAYIYGPSQPRTYFAGVRGAF